MKKIQWLLLIIFTAFALNVQAEGAVGTDDIESISMQVMEEDEGESNGAFRMLTLPEQASSMAKKSSAAGLATANEARPSGEDVDAVLEAGNSAEAKEIKDQAKENSEAAKQAAKQQAVEAREAAKENAERAAKRANENKK